MLGRKIALYRLSGLREIGEDFFRDAECFVDDGSVVCARDETGFKSRRREMYAPLKHAMEELLEALYVGRRHFFQRCRNAVTEIDAEHATDGIRAEGDARCVSAFFQTSGQLGGTRREILVEAGSVEQTQGGEAGCHGHRVARERTCLVYPAQRCNMGHDVGAASEGAHGHAAANDLCQGGDVRLDACQPLYPFWPYAETGHDFVEDQHGAITGAQLAQTFEKAFLWLDQVHIAGNWFNNDAGNLFRIFFESRLHGTQVVVVQYQRVLNKFRRHTGGGRVAESQHAGTRLYQQAIGVAVVAAFKFDDACPPGIAPRQTNSRHRGLRAGAHQTDLFHGRQASNDSFGDPD